MIKNFETINSKIYTLPCDFFVQVKENENKDVTEFYLIHKSFKYEPCIFKIKTADIKEEELSDLVAEQFKQNCFGFFYDVEFHEYEFEERYGYTMYKKIENLKAIEIPDPEEINIIIYKLSDTYTVELSDDFTCSDSNHTRIKMKHKNYPVIRCNVKKVMNEFIAGRELEYIEFNANELKKEFREFLKYYAFAIECLMKEKEEEKD